MSALVTLPGDIPGLLRRGAPVCYDVFLRHTGEILDYRETYLGTGINNKAHYIAQGEFGTWTVTREGVAKGGKSAVRRVCLDLSEPAGRDIAVRWIAEKLGVETGLTAPMFDMSERGVWVLTCGWEPLRRWFFHPDPDYGCGNTNWSAVPGLPNDRAQGIEALRIIVLHLAGRQP